ncbi:hypothetical protein A1O1_06738 [Capronia coronata CBS 617.96]|uniref:DUF7896 domain-containing protein n=1 Tax=Capronia coronata CBS 617.96 TaxID=1182541 RepID=W9YLG9_9EURO|nr:uncharacterized protein A1O1_06738 [Capronia coronata CBS 617.96]EXJ83119.1 hypothetical protein A1O1_06738 [Capronia coronata CBS 617.96]
MDSGALIEVLRSCRAVYHQDHQHLSAAEREKGWCQYWDSISNALKDSPSSTTQHGVSVAQKRSASRAMVGGMEPASKRTDPASSMASSAPSAPILERRISAPVGPTASRHQPGQLSMRPSASVPAPTSATIGPMPIPRRHNNGQRRTSTAASYPHRYNGPNLNFIEEVQDMSPSDFLAKSSDDYHPQTMALTPPPTIGKRGELLTNQNISQLISPYAAVALESPEVYTPMTATSDSSLMAGTTVASEPMTRTNTNDVLCEGFGMFRMDSVSVSKGPKASYMLASSFPIVPDPDSTHSFSFSSVGTDSGYNPVTQLCFPDDELHSSSSPSSTEMKDSLSTGSNTSSVSVSLASRLSTREPLQQEVARQTNTVSLSRPLAPKMERSRNASSSGLEFPEPKLVAVQAEDGTVKHKAEITRTVRQQPPRKTTFCQFCNDQPQGFHGDHELRRHIERHHSQVRRVWVCKDASKEGNFLSNCKACRNHKTYGANYNAAAHLRRAHFNPCKNRRGGRGKKSEHRGGMGGGNSPSMEVLKSWMYEELELNVNGRVVVQNLHPETTTTFSTAAVEEFVNANSNSNDMDTSDFEMGCNMSQEDMSMAGLTSDPLYFANVMPTQAYLSHSAPLNAGYDYSRFGVPDGTALSYQIST